MSTETAAPTSCWRCGTELPPLARACASCGALVHAASLERRAELAKAAEAESDFSAALTQWRAAYELLPPETTQAQWILARIRGLEPHVPAEPDPAKPGNWKVQAGIGAVVVLLLTKGKLLLGLLKLPFLGSLFAFFAVYWTQFGGTFALGFTILILIHEMGHFLEIKRRGLPADMPVFLPGLGAYVRWKAQGVSLETRAMVSLAGPMAGLLAAAGTAAAYYATGAPIWAALTRVGAWLNLLNLAPVWVLDGGQAALALTRRQRVLLLVAIAVAWAGSGESVLFLVLLGAVWSLFVKGAASRPSVGVLALFVGVLALLALLMALMPGEGAALPTTAEP